MKPYLCLHAQVLGYILLDTAHAYICIEGGNLVMARMQAGVLQAV